MWDGINITHKKMELLSHNPLFVNGGRIGVLAYFGIVLGDWLNIVSANQVIALIVGLLSIAFISMQIYFVYLKTKKEKDEIKRLRKRLRK